MFDEVVNQFMRPALLLLYKKSYKVDQTLGSILLLLYKVNQTLRSVLLMLYKVNHV